METKVKVTADKDGKIIVPSAGNPAWGHSRVEQIRMMFDDNGFVRKTKLSALVPGKVEDLTSLGWQSGQELPGKIIVKEQLTPFNKKNPERDLKKAGETGVTCMQNGKPIYRNTFYTPDPDAKDVLEEHTNGEEIKTAYAALAAAGGQGKPEFKLDDDN